MRPAPPTTLWAAVEPLDLDDPERFRANAVLTCDDTTGMSFRGLAGRPPTEVLPRALGDYLVVDLEKLAGGRPSRRPPAGRTTSTTHGRALTLEQWFTLDGDRGVDAHRHVRDLVVRRAGRGLRRPWRRRGAPSPAGPYATHEAGTDSEPHVRRLDDEALTSLPRHARAAQTSSWTSPLPAARCVLRHRVLAVPDEAIVVLGVSAGLHQVMVLPPSHVAAALVRD